MKQPRKSSCHVFYKPAVKENKYEQSKILRIYKEIYYDHRIDCSNSIFCMADKLNNPSAYECQ